MFTVRSFHLRVRSGYQSAVGVLTLVAVPVVVAQNPCVHFDVPEVVSCRVRIDDAFQADNAGEMLVEATFDVSSLVRVGRESDLSQYLYVVESPDRSLRVADYSPKTKMISPVSGNVGVQRHSEASSNLGISGSLSPDARASVQASASKDNSNGAKFNYELLPPKQLLFASGTVARGTAVYYKLRSSQQTSMDGVKQFGVVFRVPSCWRGDYVRLRCAAYQRSGSGKQQPICGSSEFLVGLYLVGDDVAKATVIELTKSDLELRGLAQQSRDLIDRQRFPSMTDKLGSLFNVSEPKIPEDWFRRVIRSDAGRMQSFERHLPDELRESVRRYRKARVRVRTLSKPVDVDDSVDDLTALAS
ncbi:MAG: hypothetical protein P8N76_05840 [Pirellulaceae bacterium]|nr:hypothetical protein [Pirellulaceae bacterium]